MASVVVVGGGLAGLATAARLARHRHNVTVIDAGTPGELRMTGHEPASFTLPAVFRDLFRKTGRALETEVTLVPVNPARRYMWPDGRVLDLPTASRAAMLDAVGGALGRAAATEWDAFVTWGGARWSNLRQRAVPAGEAAGSLAPTTPRVRLRDPANRRVLGRYAVEAGFDPARARADLAVFPYLEQTFGAWQIDGGLATLTAALARRALRCGATLHGDLAVIEAVVRDGAIAGVRTVDGSVVPADIVVDTVGLRRRVDATSHARPRTTSELIVQVRTADPIDLPVETVLFRGTGQASIVVVRPDVTADPNGVVVRATMPISPAEDQTAGLARVILAELNRAGVRVDGEVVGVHVRPARRLTGVVRWPRRSGGGWLDLRAGVTDHHVRGLLHAAPQVTGSLAVPWQGLAAALAAHQCGQVPRRGAS